MAGVVGGVRGQFGGWQGEDEPAVAGVDRREFEDVSEECTNRSGGELEWRIVLVLVEAVE